MLVSVLSLIGAGCLNTREQIPRVTPVPTEKVVPSAMPASNTGNIVDLDEQAKEWQQFDANTERSFSVKFPGVPVVETSQLKDGTKIRVHTVKKFNEIFTVREEIRLKDVSVQEISQELDVAEIQKAFPNDEIVDFSKQEGRIQVTFIPKADKQSGKVFIKSIIGPRVVTALVEYNSVDVFKLNPNPFIDSFRAY